MLASFLLGFGAGIAATPHCLGMCGGFPLHLAKPNSRGSAGLRQVLFVAGKSFTYVFLGALAAAVGVILLKNTRLAGAAPALRIAVGAITLVFGLAMLGLRLPRVSGFPFRDAPLKSPDTEGFVAGALGGLLSNPTPGSAFVLGLGVGFLPCPLPMGMLAVAASSHSVPDGIALMAGVGLGTAPGLLAVGIFGMGLNWKLRKAGMRAAGVVVAIIGLLTICRAIGGMPRSHVVDSVVPPCCQEHNTK